MTTTAPRVPTTYARRLGLFDGTMVVVGGIIGAGIFLNPAIVAQRVGSPGLILAAWALGGVVALLGALCFAELGARRPEAGGGYVYLRETLGPLPAFLYGWTLLLVINSGGIAAVGMTFASYAADLAGLPAAMVKPLAIAAIAVLTVINYVGIRPGATTQNIFTVLKLVALGGLILAGLTLATRGTEASGATEAPGPALHGVADVAVALGAALIPVLFAFGGWQNANFVAGEIREPQRNVPRALLLGVGIVVATYLLANLAYVTTLGAAGLAASAAPASDTMRALLGPAGGTFIAAGIVLSTFGFLNLSILAAPRVYQAMADDGLFFRWAARLHPRYRTPAGAIVFQSAWAVVLLLSGTYGQLLDWVVFGDWIFFGLVVVTLFVYRAREGRGDGAAGTADGATPEAGVATAGEAPFRTFGYPWLPACFVLVAGIVVIGSIASNPVNAVLGSLLIGAGVPVFLFWRRRLV
jgi:APA family basic amino acid/polyamine antiporter|nr:MAG: amino acid permease [bacterium]